MNKAVNITLGLLIGLVVSVVIVGKIAEQEGRK